MGAREAPPRRRGQDGRLLPQGLVVATAVLAGAGRLPFLGRPLSPDEAGFLLVGGQWSPGSSLYGDYWVDRPPLIITVFAVAERLGGATPLRVLGVVAVALAVLLAAGIGLVGAPHRRWAPTLAAVTAAVFLSTPLFGTREVNGELLAAPLVLAGLLAVLAALRRGRGALVWWLAAGTLATAAVAVKQSMADVAVAGVAALLWQARSAGVRRTAYDALALVSGAVVALVVTVIGAWTRGTEPGALWEAAVSFRFQAAAVISSDDPSANALRLHSLVDATGRSAAPVLLLVPLLAVGRARERGPLPLLTAAVLFWEVVAVAAGGSYWWHYLVGTVPGLVLLVVAIARHRPGLQVVTAVVVAYAALVAAQVTMDYPGLTRGQRADQRAVSHFSALARPGDTAVVAYGTASMLYEAGVSSPYPYLWSLPVRVRDPHLTALAAVLRGRHRPTWVVVRGPGLESWGIEAGTAQRELDSRYRLVAVEGEWRFFRVLERRGTLSR